MLPAFSSRAEASFTLHRSLRRRAISFLCNPSPKESSNEHPAQPPSFAGHRRNVRRRRAHSRILARILARAGQDACRRNLSRHLERSTSRIPRARLQQAHRGLRHAIDPPWERPAFAADGGKRRQTAVRCGPVRLPASSRCCEAGPDRGISGRQAPNYKDLLPEFQGKWGPRITMQIVGIGYNPQKIKTPPKSWDVLWDPQYKGRVGLTALNSQLGIAFLAEINRLRGGNEENFEPAFKALREMLPNVGAIGANLGAYATLWQQEQIDIAPYNFNFVQTLKGKDVPVELSIPGTGAVGWFTSMHVVANAAEPDLAVEYIDTHLDPAVQRAMARPPYDVIPTNSNVALEGAITSIARTHAELAKIRSFDWEKLNPQRSTLRERFNRGVTL